MANLINKAAVVAEIEKRIEEYKNMKIDSSYYEGMVASLEFFRDEFINSLEVKEVDEQQERMSECPFKKVGCEIYEGHILECKGECSWVVDHPKLKQLKAQKGE